MKKWFNVGQGIPCMWKNSRTETSDISANDTEMFKISKEQNESNANDLSVSKKDLKTSDEFHEVQPSTSITHQMSIPSIRSSAKRIPETMSEVVSKVESQISDVESTYNGIVLVENEVAKHSPVPVSIQPHTSHSRGSQASNSCQSSWKDSHIYGNISQSHHNAYGAAALPSVPIHSSSELEQNTHPNWGHRCSECRIKVQMEVEFVSGNQKSNAPLKKGIRSLSLPKKMKYKGRPNAKDNTNKKRRHPWSLKLNNKMKSTKGTPEPSPTATTSFKMGATCCVCPSYEYSETEYQPGDTQSLQREFTFHAHTPLVELPQVTATEADNGDDEEETYGPQESQDDGSISGLFATAREGSNQIIHTFGYNPAFDRDLRLLLERSLRFGFSAPRSGSSLNMFPRQVHMQVDYVHHLVPDLVDITNCRFYWGKMNRYEAEKLLENKPEGTFLLRDSAQEDFLFSVSFRRYKRSLHARIEQSQHRFSFDSLDPNVYSTKTVCGLIEYYKDPSCCRLFEPLLTNPMPRTFPFQLQHLCRTTICSRLKYDDIAKLKLPRKMNEYLKEYHYKQRVSVRHWD